MRLVITGANGFLGKNLIQHVDGLGFSFVRLLDIHPVEEIDMAIDYDTYAIDLADPSLENLIQENDVVIHLAWRSNPAITGGDVEAESELNWPASENLINVCTRKKAKLVFASSGGTVYGHPDEVPTKETHPTNPISAYGKVKLEVEKAIMKAHKGYGLQYLILRPSNLYGPGFNLKKGLGVIGHWVDTIKQGNSLKMVGDGQLTRDFIHVNDLCQGIMTALKVENEILNLGTGEGVSLNDLKQTFEKILGRTLPVVHLEDRKHDVEVNVLAIEKMRKLTNWTPKIKLEEGIRKLLV